MHVLFTPSIHFPSLPFPSLLFPTPLLPSLPPSLFFLVPRSEKEECWCPHRTGASSLEWYGVGTTPVQTSASARPKEKEWMQSTQKRRTSASCTSTYSTRSTSSTLEEKPTSAETFLLCLISCCIGSSRTSKPCAVVRSCPSVSGLDI